MNNHERDLLWDALFVWRKVVRHRRRDFAKCRGEQWIDALNEQVDRHQRIIDHG